MKFRWHVWSERLKSWFLIILVLSSLIFSGLIWLGTPNELAVDHPNFYSSPMYGSERSVNEFIRPSAVWLWTANNELFRYSGTSTEVQKMLDILRKSSFLTGKLLAKNSAQAVIPPKTPYLLFDYHGLLAHASLWPLAIPVPDLMVSIPVSQMVAFVPIEKSHQYKMIVPDGNQVYVGYLQMPEGLDRWLQPTDSAIPFAQIPRGDQVFNLPYSSLQMPVYAWILYHPVATHVIDSFFLDPSLIQPIAKTKSQTIYSDGTQSVTMKTGYFGNQLIFSCPSGMLKGYQQSANLALQVAVPFMDSHGGFVGDQVLAGIQNTTHYTDLEFQDDINGWPLFSQLDQIRVRVQNGMVTGLWHYLSYPGMETSEPREKILSGVQLLSKLSSKMFTGLRRIELGYGTKQLNNQLVELKPVYKLIYQQKPSLFLDAQSGHIFTGTGM